MKDFNDILPSLIKSLPRIISRKGVHALLQLDKNALSYESASSCMAAIDVAEETGALSREEGNAIDTPEAPDFNSKQVKAFTLEDSEQKNFADIKFKALVDIVKKDDMFLFTEFAEVDAARNRIASEIVSKYENDFNSFLTALAGTEGVDKSVVGQLVGTKIQVGDI
jgi:hypothetical protein